MIRKKKLNIIKYFPMIFENRIMRAARFPWFPALLLAAAFLHIPSAVMSQSAVKEDIPEEIVRRVDPSVVAIQHKRTAGSGFVVTADGYIISNGHVVKGDDKENPMRAEEGITVILNDERKYSAKVIGFCMDPDVALLKIEPDEPLHPVEFADTRGAQIGQHCFAVGTPVGLKRTFTSGILSNVDRTDLGTFTTVFQTDAAINPGNSGGPLFDREGRVLGVNTYASRGSNNLGFTIPSHVVKVLREHLKRYGCFRRCDIPFFFVCELYDELALALGVERGLLLAYVMEDTPAAAAGMQRGDVIVALDGQPCSARTRAELMEFGWDFAIREPGTQVELTILRSEANNPGNFSRKVITTQMEIDEPRPALGRFPGEDLTLFYDALGLGYKRILRLHRVYYGLSDQLGVLVSNVEANGAAGKADLVPGMVITHVNGKATDDINAFQRVLEKALARRKRFIDLEVRHGRNSFKTALAPYYDMKECDLLLVVPEGGVNELELIVRELTADGASIIVATADGNCNFVDSAMRVVKLADVQGAEFDLLLMVDGRKASDLQSDRELRRVVRESYGAGAVVSAIGSTAITLILADPQIKEKKITTVKEFSGEALRLEARYTGNSVEKDGRVLTCTGWTRENIREFLGTLRGMLRIHPL